MIIELNIVQTCGFQITDKGNKYMQKILILGGSGMLGHAMKTHFNATKIHDVHWTERKFDYPLWAGNSTLRVHFLQADALNVSVQFEDILSSWMPDYVINCIGIVKPRMADNIARAIFINALFPHILARVCKQQGCRLIHVTTDCVFSGRQGPYNETNLHDALDDYGKSKSLGEPSMDAMVIRTSIIGPEPFNKHSLISWAQKQSNQIVQGYINHWWNGVTTFELARIFQQIIDGDSWKIGTYHIHSPEAVNKYELLDLIFQRYSVFPSAFKAIDALIGCDRRLTTTDPEFLKGFAIPSISYQIGALPE